MNTNKKNYYLVMIIFASFLGNSCTKKDTIRPIISIVHPIASDVFSSKSNINLEINMSDNEDMHECTVSVKDSIGNVVFSDAPIVHELPSLNYKQSFKLDSLTYEKTYTLLVTVSDHHDNIGTNSVSFKVKP